MDAGLCTILHRSQSTICETTIKDFDSFLHFHILPMNRLSSSDPYSFLFPWPLKLTMVNMGSKKTSHGHWPRSPWAPPFQVQYTITSYHLSFLRRLTLWRMQTAMPTHITLRNVPIFRFLLYVNRCQYANIQGY